MTVEKPPCAFHPSKPRFVRCTACRESICELCTFRLEVGRYCPDCATAPRDGRGATSKAVLGLVLGAAGAGIFLAFLVWVAANPTQDPSQVEAKSMVIGIVSLIAMCSGLCLGFTATDDAPQGSMLGIVTAAFNGILLLLFLGLSIFGMSQ